MKTELIPFSQDDWAGTLDDVVEGRLNLEAAQVRFPGRRKTLAGLVALADLLKTPAASEPSAEFRARSRARLLAKIRPLPESVRRAQPVRSLVPGRLPFPSILTALAGLAIAFGLILTFGGAGLARAADASAPGDSLYGIDLALETIQYRMSTSPEFTARLALDNSRERIAELQMLLTRNASGEYILQAIAGFEEAVNLMVREYAAIEDSGARLAFQSSMEAGLAASSAVLASLQNQVPAQAKDAMDRALKQTERERENAENDRNNDTTGNHPEASQQTREKEKTRPAEKPTKDTDKKSTPTKTKKPKSTP